MKLNLSRPDDLSPLNGRGGEVSVITKPPKLKYKTSPSYFCKYQISPNISLTEASTNAGLPKAKFNFPHLLVGTSCLCFLILFISFAQHKCQKTIKTLLFEYLSFNHTYIGKHTTNFISNQSDRTDNDYKHTCRLNSGSSEWLMTFGLKHWNC